MIKFRIGDRVESDHLSLIMVTEKEEDGGIQRGYEEGGSGNEVDRVVIC